MKVSLCGPHGPEKPQGLSSYPNSKPICQDHSSILTAQDSTEVLQGRLNSTRAEALSAELRLDLYY